MFVTDYLKKNGIAKLQEEFAIKVRKYNDRYIINYNQIDSPRFHPIVDECRGLIVDKDFNVMCRSFQRFYNLGEGTSNNGLYVRSPSFKEESIQARNLKESTILHKMDGTLINFYWDYFNNKWQSATRGAAFAEGDTGFDISFSDLVEKAENYTTVVNYLNDFKNSQDYTFMFELTSPYNRIVTPYDKIELTWLSAKLKDSGVELHPEYIHDVGRKIGLKTPIVYKANSHEDLLNLVEKFPSLQEGVVLSWFDKGIVKRLKLKNTKYCAIHNMRANGQISPKQVLILVGQNEQFEYLNYFSEDKPFFDLVEKALKEYKDKNLKFYETIKDTEEQKDFALKVQANKEIHPALMFQLRKGSTMDEIIKKQLDNPKNLVKTLDLKKKFKDQFGVEFED